MWSFCFDIFGNARQIVEDCPLTGGSHRQSIRKPPGEVRLWDLWTTLSWFHFFHHSRIPSCLHLPEEIRWWGYTFRSFLHFHKCQQQLSALEKKVHILKIEIIQFLRKANSSESNSYSISFYLLLSLFASSEFDGKSRNSNLGLQLEWQPHDPSTNKHVDCFLCDRRQSSNLDADPCCNSHRSDVGRRTCLDFGTMETNWWTSG